MICYKITSFSGHADNRYWEKLQWQEQDQSFFVAYPSAFLAALVGPYNYVYEKDSILWEAECPAPCQKVCECDGIHIYTKKLRIFRETEKPAISLRQRVHAAILAAKTSQSTLNFPDFNVWAKEWLKGNVSEENAKKIAQAAQKRNAFTAMNAARAAVWADRTQYKEQTDLKFRYDVSVDHSCRAIIGSILENTGKTVERNLNCFPLSACYEHHLKQVMSPLVSQPDPPFPIERFFKPVS